MPRIASRKTPVEVLERRLTPKQELFLECYLDPHSPTFANAYQSAIKVGYSDHYARQITAEKRITWLRDNHRLAQLEESHIVKGFERHATEGKPDISLRALVELAKLKGMYIDRSLNEINIRFTNNVPRPRIVDSGLAEPEHIEEPSNIPTPSELKVSPKK